MIPSYKNRKFTALDKKIDVKYITKEYKNIIKNRFMKK